MTPANPTTLVGLINSIPDDQTALIRPSRTSASPTADLQAAGAGRGRGAGRRRREPRRPRRHRAAQRPAEHRHVPRRVDGRHGGAAEPGATRKTSSASISRTPTPRCCSFRPTASTRRAARPATGADPDGRHGRHRHGHAVRASPGRKPVAAPRSTTSRWCCTRAAAPAGRSACRSSHAQPVDLRAATSRAATRCRPDDVSLCVMPLFHVHGLVASTLATLATGGTVVVPAEVQPAVVLARRAGARRHVVLRGADASTSCCSRASTNGCAAAGGRREAALHPLVQRVAAAAGDARPRGGVRRAGARGLRHDRSGAPDGVESAAAGRSASRARSDAAPTCRSASWTPREAISPPASAARSSSRDRTSSRGYENNPEANATSFVDGWFRTGDQGFLDENGYLTLSGRLKELINRGGEKISPREIDEVLLAHPAVAEAVCFGVPHPTWGEEVAAAVVAARRPVDARADLLAYCKERLADFKRPKQIHITDTIPRTATGKIQRGVVAQAFARKRVVKIVIAGAGAIGGYIGARLAQAGADVVLFARGPHLRAMQERGLRVIEPRRRLRGPRRRSPATSRRSARPTSCSSASRRTASRRSRRSLRPLFGPDTVVVSTQNGIPWWYFQRYGGELDGLAPRARRSRRGHRRGHRAAPRRRIAGLLRHRHRRARRDPSHRRQSHQLRRARRHASRSASRRSPRR